MTVLYLGALAAIALSLSVLMAGARMVWAGSHIAVRTARITDDRHRYQSPTSMFFPLPLRKGVVT